MGFTKLILCDIFRPEINKKRRLNIEMDISHMGSQINRAELIVWFFFGAVFFFILIGIIMPPRDGG